MNIKKFKLSELKPASYNPRTITPEALNGLQKSIKEFGYLQPIIVNIHNPDKPTIVGGHQRVKALLKEGKTDAECVVVDFDQIKEKAANVALNSETISGDWEIEGLEKILEELKFEYPEFEEVNLDDLAESLEIDLDNLGGSEDGEKEADNVPEIEEKPVIKAGDLIEMGAHRLLCGDSTKAEDVERLMRGEKADMVFTDPPYGVSYQSNMRVKSQQFDVLENDNIFIIDWIPFLERFSVGFVFIWTSWKVLGEWMRHAKPIGNMSNMIIWNKGGGGIGDLEKTFLSDYEVAMVFNRGAKLTGKRIGSVWGIAKDGASEYLHPTQKPVALAMLAIQSVTIKKEKILDLFLGSGTTLIAAEKTGRRCFGMEIDPGYCQVTTQRYVDFTGQNEITINGNLVSWRELCGE